MQSRINQQVNIRYGVQVTNGRTFLRVLELLKKSSFNTLSGLKVIIAEKKLNPDIVSKSTELGIPFEFIDVSKVDKSKRRKFVADQTLIILQKYNIDYLFLLANRILEGELLTKYQNKIINFHSAILPSFKGEKPIDRALENKAFLLGITAHFIDDKMDEGIPIMMYIVHNSFFTGYFETVLDNIYLMLAQIVYWLSDNRITIEKHYCIVADANYETANFIPNIEITNENN